MVGIAGDKVGNGCHRATASPTLMRPTTFYFPGIVPTLSRYGMLSDGMIKTYVGGSASRANTLCYCVGKPISSLEPILATDPQTASNYAVEFLKRRFPAGEAAIRKNRLCWRSYLTNLIKFVPEDKVDMLGDVVRWDEAIARVFSPRVAAAYIEEVQAALGKLRWDRHWSYLEDEVFPKIVDAAIGLDYQPSKAASVKVASAGLSKFQWQAGAWVLDRSIQGALLRYGFLSKDMLAEIAKKPGLASGYARHILKRRWPEAEPYIAASGRSRTVALYASDVVGGRWPEGEATLFRDGYTERPAYAYEYLMNIKRRDPGAIDEELIRKVEEAVSADPLHSFKYAWLYLKGPWVGPYASRALATMRATSGAQRCQLSYGPSKDYWKTYTNWLETAGFPTSEAKVASKQIVLERVLPDPDSPWFDGHLPLLAALNHTGLETHRIREVIKTAPWVAYSYAITVVGGRWREAEPLIRKNQSAWDAYCDQAEEVWGDAQDLLAEAEEDDSYIDPPGGLMHEASAKTGAAKFHGFDTECMTRWNYYQNTVYQTLTRHNMWSKKLKSAFLSSADAADGFAEYVAHGRFPEGEAIIATDAAAVYNYTLGALKTRFPEPHRAAAEAELQKIDDLWSVYFERFLVSFVAPDKVNFFGDVIPWQEAAGRVAGSPAEASGYVHVMERKLESLQHFMRGNYIEDEIATQIAQDARELGFGVQKTSSVKTAASSIPFKLTANTIRSLNSSGLLSKRILSCAAGCSDAAVAYAIATNTPFPAGEDAIARDEYNAIVYARYVLELSFTGARTWAARHLKGKTRGKTASSRLGFTFYNKRGYSGNHQKTLECLQRLGFRMTRFQEAALQSPRMAGFWSANVMNARWPEAEGVIATDPEAAYFYAIKWIKAKWPEAEPAILTSPRFAALYAQFVLRERWPEAEPVICQDEGWARDYALRILGYKYPSKQDEWIAGMRPDHVVTLKGRKPIHGGIIAGGEQNARREGKLSSNHGFEPGVIVTANDGRRYCAAGQALPGDAPNHRSDNGVHLRQVRASQVTPTAQWCLDPRQVWLKLRSLVLTDPVLGFEDGSLVSFFARSKRVSVLVWWNSESRCWDVYVGSASKRVSEPRHTVGIIAGGEHHARQEGKLSSDHSSQSGVLGAANDGGGCGGSEASLRGIGAAARDIRGSLRKVCSTQVKPTTVWHSDPRRVWLKLRSLVMAEPEVVFDGAQPIGISAKSKSVTVFAHWDPVGKQWDVYVGSAASRSSRTAATEFRPHIIFHSEGEFDGMIDVLKTLNRRGLYTNPIRQAAEQVLARFGQEALDYAMTVTRARFPAGEREIRRLENGAYWYALTVIKGPWQEAESYIALGDHSREYAENVLGLDYEEYIAWEDRLCGRTAMRTSSAKVSSSALGHVINGQYDYDLGVDLYDESGVIQALRRGGFESKALVDSYKHNPDLLLDYIHFVRKSAWTEMEPYLVSNRFVADYYSEEFRDGVPLPGVSNYLLDADGERDRGVQIAPKTADEKVTSAEVVSRGLDFTHMDGASLLKSLIRNFCLSQRLKSAIDTAFRSKKRLNAYDWMMSERFTGPWADAMECGIANIAAVAYEYARVCLHHKWDGPYAAVAERAIRRSRKYTVDYLRLPDSPTRAASPKTADEKVTKRVNFQGFNIAIERPKGSTRSGVDDAGNKWSRVMTQSYGHVSNEPGADGDSLDVYLGDDESSDMVFIINQLKADGSFDEHKVLLGFPDAASAMRGYLSNMKDGWTQFGALKIMDLSDFRLWMATGDRMKLASAH